MASFFKKKSSEGSKEEDEEVGSIFAKSSRRQSESDVPEKELSKSKSGKSKSRSSSSERSRSSSKEKEGRSRSEEKYSEQGTSSKSSKKEGKSSSGKEGKKSSKEGKEKKTSRSSSKKPSSSKPGNLIYAMVARKTYILAEFTSPKGNISGLKGNFSSVAQEHLEKLETEETRTTISYGEYMLNFLTDSNFTFMVLVDENYPKAISFAFLERVKDDFSARYKKTATKLRSGGLQKEYAPKLQEHVQYVLDHPEEMDKFTKIKSQVSEVKGIMQQNINKAFVRGEKLENLQDKSDLLKDQAGTFQKQGEQIKNKMWLQNMGVKIFIFGGFILLGYIFLKSLIS